jgi:hypothetical protein
MVSVPNQHTKAINLHGFFLFVFPASPPSHQFGVSRLPTLSSIRIHDEFDAGSGRVAGISNSGATHTHTQKGTARVDLSVGKSCFFWILPDR